MNAASIISLILTLLEGVLSNVKGSGAADALQIAQGIQAAIDNLEKVIGTTVTYQQLESLRVKPSWD